MIDLVAGRAVFCRLQAWCPLFTYLALYLAQPGSACWPQLTHYQDVMAAAVPLTMWLAACLMATQVPTNAMWHAVKYVAVAYFGVCIFVHDCCLLWCVCVDEQCVM